jgi:dephospho-CoA kinase
MRTGITGGIGSGKSYVCRLLSERGINVYDCDAAAKRLMRSSPQLRQQITDLIGPSAYLANEEFGMRNSELPVLNKAVVARFLLASEANAKALNAIVHPAVFDDFLQSGSEWVESAILYESGLDKLVDRVVVVTAPLEVRIARVMARDNITRDKALEWINKQLLQEELVARADYEIVNDGQQPLFPQIELFLFNKEK